MTRSHAKTNTTQSSLTYYERSLIRRENAAKRLGGDSFKPLDHCYLCLSRLTDPISCNQGHMYCRECIISDLISQKAGIEATKRDLEAWDAREERERQEARMKARERVVSDFEKGMGLSGGVLGVKMTGTGNEAGKGKMEDLAREAEERAMKAIEAEHVEARKQKLAAFWLPSNAPEGRLTPIKDVKLETVCQAGSTPHPISRKTLLPVILTYPSPKSTTPTCPSCTKELSNSNSSVLLSSRKPAVSATQDSINGEEPPLKKKKKGKTDVAPYVCGHVVCATCYDTIVKPSGRCVVCEATVDESGRIPLGKEGTGFAAAGGAEVKPDRIAFRM